MKVRLHNVTFRRCVAEQQGGGLWTYKSDVLVTNSTFDTCRAANGGGGVIVYGSNLNPSVQTNYFIGCNFTNCQGTGSASLGGGALVQEGAQAVFEDTGFYGCHTGSRGGAVGTPSGAQVVTLRRVLASRCSSGERGGAFGLHGTARLVDTHIVECSSFDAGGAP